MSELSPNPLAVAQRLAEEHRQAQEEASVNAFVDITNENSMNEFSDYLNSRPANAEEAAETPNHYDNTVAETENGYENMSMPQLAKELAEAEVAGDKTKFTELDEILSAKAESFVDSVKSDRTADELPEGDRDTRLENVHNRLAKIRAAEVDRLTSEKALPKREAGATLDGTEGTNDYFADKAKADAETPEQTREERLAELDQRQKDAANKYNEIVAAGDERNDERADAVLEYGKARTEYVEAKFEDVSDEELMQQFNEAAERGDNVAHNDARDEINRRIKVAERKKAADADGVAEGEATDVHEAVTEEKTTEKGVRARWNQLKRAGSKIGDGGRYAGAWLQSRAVNARHNREATNEKSGLRRAAPYIGGVALGLAALGVYKLQSDGLINLIPYENAHGDNQWSLIDVNPFNGHTQAHALASQEFATFVEGTTKMREAGFNDQQIMAFLEELAKTKS